MREFLLKFTATRLWLLLMIFSLPLVTVGQTVSSDKADYAPGETATISGSGWTGDSLIDIYIDEDPPIDLAYQHDFYDVEVDQDGNWSVQMNIAEYHLGITFYLTVTGKQTGRIAKYMFTDGQTKFSVTGLPGGNNVTVNYSVNNSTLNESLTFSTSGNSSSDNFFVAKNSQLYFSFPNSIVIGSDTYLLVSTDKSSPVDVSNSALQITANYELEGGSGGLTVTSPDCALGGEFSITYTPANGSSVTETRTTPYSFDVKKNTSYTITSIQGTVNGNYYAGSGSVNGTTPNSNDFDVEILLGYEDYETPVFANVPSDQLNVDMDPGVCGATITWADPTANDNCDGSVAVVRTDATGYNSGDLFAAGSYTISYSATDTEGNVETASFDVSVNADAEKPVFANVPSDQLNVDMDPGVCGATITWTDPTANDNCDGSVAVVRTDATGYNSGDLFAAGSYTISYSATDTEGNVETASFDVSVNADAEKPVFANVPSDKLNVDMDPGVCGATITWTDPIANDNCDGSVTVVRTDATGYNSGDLFAAGSYTISYSATDTEGNVETASFDVSVNADAEKPVFANVPSDQLNVDMDPGVCGATITWTDPTANDNCDGSVAVVRTDATGYNSGDLFAAGSYTISYSATDTEGNVETASFDVSVNADAEKPVFANVPSDQLNVDMDPGVCGATITWADPTANDNCDGSVAVVRTDATGYNSGDLFAAGSYTISYSATDTKGNVETASFDVSVNADAEKPVFANVPSDQLNVDMDPGVCGATITWTDPTANDNCDGSVTVVRTDVTGYNSGDLFAAGSYTISYSATDTEGNVETASFDVSVNADAEKPVFANVPSDQLNVDMDPGVCGATITWTDPTANDNCDGSVAVVRTDATGYNSGDLFAAGSYTISYSATDTEGNVETASFDVSVNADAEKPVFANVPSDQLNVDMDPGVCGATITWADPTANDNCDGSVAVVRTDATGYNSGDLFAAGSYTISYSATDTKGNVETASFDVSVNADAEKPVFANVPSDQLNVDMDPGVCGATITWTDPTANDNCDGSVTVVRTDVTGYNSGDLFAAGSYTISYSATDTEGNVETASFDVSVNADAEKPVFANVPSDQLNVDMDPGVCGATITWTDPTANDNCDGSVTVVRTDATGYNSGDLFAAGSYTISYSATDTEGNVETASFDVSVNADAEKPVFANVPSDQLNVDMDPGVCGATITWTDPTANDNCDGSVTVVRTDATGYNSGDLFAAGSYTISYSATDTKGNVQTASFDVSVNADAEKPVFANVPSDQLNVDMDPGVCGATITWADPTANDNCDGSVTVVRTDATGYNSGDLFAAGSYTISYSATDTKGNVQTASFDVSVNADAEKPVFANVPSDQLNVDMDPGVCGATITWADPTANDNCDGSVTVVRTDATGYNSGDLFAAGSYTISYSTTDTEGNVETASFDVSVNADAEKPTITTTAKPLTVESDGDGNTEAFQEWLDNHGGAEASDNCSDVIWNYDYDELSDGCGDTGITEVTFTAEDASGNKSQTAATFTIVDTTDPELQPIQGPEDPAPVGTTTTVLSSGYQDVSPVTAMWYFSSDGKFEDGDEAEFELDGTVSGNIQATFDSSLFVTAENPKGAGVYGAKLVVEDACGNVSETIYESFIVFFDPDGGFVTGGGWIYSLPGSYPEKPLAEGKANFGFNAKYKNGKNNMNEVDGNTNFQFKDGDFHFKSSSHEDMSLVISGEKKATYRGIGSVNGNGSYYFVVTVIDGDASGGDGIDYFRIVVYGEGTTSPSGQALYDNEFGAALNAEASTALGGGSIVIHKPKAGGSPKAQQEATVAQTFVAVNIVESMTVSPNPVETTATVRFSLNADADVLLEVFDYNQRRVKVLYTGKVTSGQVKEVSFDRGSLPSGTYFVKLSASNGQVISKQVIVN